MRSALLLRSLQAEGWGRADSASRDSVAACVLAFHSWINGHRTANGSLCRGYGIVLHPDPQVKHVVVILIWLNALFMPIWSASWVLPAGFKGARDARYAMWVSMLSMWGCRVVVGYVLGIMLGWGWLVSGWECLPTGLCGPCCFTGEWLLDVGCGNTLDPNRKSVKKPAVSE